MDWSTALTDPEALRAQGLFLVEGRLVLSRVLAGAAGGTDAIVGVLSTRAAARALQLEQRLPARLTIRTPAEMEALTGFNFHRGVLALVRRPEPRTVDDVIAGPLYPVPGTRYPVPGTRPPVLVVAEHLVDVDNVGSCFRNARGFGAACVLVDDRCPDPLYRKAVRTSMGHVLEMPWAQAPIGEILDALHERGIVSIGLTPQDRRPPDAGHGGPTSERRVPTLSGIRPGLPADAPVAIIVGNEGDGLSEATIARCRHLARIPMAEGADSLNVATALAIALYEFTIRS